MPAQGTYAYDVFVSYSQADKEWVYQTLVPRLAQARLLIFIADRERILGQPSSRNIDTAIAQSRKVLLILTPDWLQNEWAVFEPLFEHLSISDDGRPRVLPLLRKPCQNLPERLGVLSHADFTESEIWDEEWARLLQAVSINKQSMITPFIATLSDPDGTVYLDDIRYISRVADSKLLREIKKPQATTIVIRAPRQTGKSSLLMRGIDLAERQGKQVVFMDLQDTEDHILQNADSFLRFLSTTISHQIKADINSINQIWRKDTAPTEKITEIIEGYLLNSNKVGLFIAIDEADKILGTPVNELFLNLIRRWRNLRAKNTLWDKISIAIVVSNEPDLLIKDYKQIPFNIGISINIDYFDIYQLQELNIRYQLPLNLHEVSELMNLLNGHPYLTNKAMYIIATRDMTWEYLKEIAPTDQGPFSGHLQRYWWMLQKDQTLIDSLKSLIDSERCSDDETFYRLSQAGLVKGKSYRSCTFQCSIYKEYFSSKI
jgi:hypothetical protein